GLIFANDKNKAEGKQFVSFLLHEETVRPYVEGALGRWFPVTKASQESPFWQADKHRTASRPGRCGICPRPVRRLRHAAACASPADDPAPVRRQSPLRSCL